VEKQRKYGFCRLIQKSLVPAKKIKFLRPPMSDHEAIIDQIYEAAADANLWPDVMHELSQTVESAGGVIVTRRADSWTGWRYSPAMALGAESYLTSKAAEESQATIRLLGSNRAGFVDALDVFTEEEWLADPMMTNWGTPAGLTRAAATAIPTPTGDLVVVQVNRRTTSPKFNPEDIACLDSFRPHLARAGLLAARWRLERLRAAAEALAMIGLPAIIIDASGAALAANSLVEKLHSYLLWLPRDRVALVDPSANDLFRSAIREVNRPAATVARSFPAKGSNDSRVIVHLVPATGVARELFEGGFALLVFTNLAEPMAPDAAVLRGLFDLTAAEARVAMGITEGFSPGEIAGRNGVAVETVRSQIKSILDKTGLHRQAQLAGLLAAQMSFPPKSGIQSD
jgi:DNA-binding CsgD family transcriptional regulator